MPPGIGGFLKGLFDGGQREGGEAGAPPLGEPVEYKGYAIHPAPRQQGGQWLTAGVIRKEIGGEVKEHAFIRADTHGSKDDAAAMAIDKGKRIVDERGDGMFG